MALGTLHVSFCAVKNIILGSKPLGIVGPLEESVEHGRMTSHSQWWQMLLSYGEGDYQERESGQHIPQKNEWNHGKVDSLNQQTKKLPDLSSSLFWPPKAITVLMAPRASSATAPAFAYAASSLSLNVERICSEETQSRLLHREEVKDSLHGALSPACPYRPYASQHWNQVSGWVLACLS